MPGWPLLPAFIAPGLFGVIGVDGVGVAGGFSSLALAFAEEFFLVGRCHFVSHKSSYEALHNLPVACYLLLLPLSWLLD